jgi:acyl-CoA thioesterase-1
MPSTTPRVNAAADHPRLRWSRGTLAALVLVGFAAAGLTLLAPGARKAVAGIDRCAAPEEITSLTSPLPRTGAQLSRGDSFTILALGSSSTYGTGASGTNWSYPSRLAALLQARFPDIDIRVLNRGVGGEVGPETAQRIARDVLPEHPDLVIWQLGTNDVLTDQDLQIETIRRSIAQIQLSGADVMLMDLQYAPAVLVHPNYRETLRAIAAVARATDVPEFHRFAMMRHWVEDGLMPMPVMLSADRLHMTDVSYDCLARQLGASILRTARASG